MGADDNGCICVRWSYCNLSHGEVLTMRVRIESVTHSFLNLELEFPIIGHFDFAWHNNSNLSYRVVAKDTLDIVKEGFSSFESAENWAIEQNYQLVME